MYDAEDRKTRNRERARYYWTKALEAEESATKTKNAEARELFLKVAKDWRGLAQLTERL